MRKEPVLTRFERKLQQSGDCWNWTGYTKGGYGYIGINNSAQLAHRWSYKHHVGDIPDGLVLDHLCRNRSCVNPWHLDPVPLTVNVNRGNHRYDKTRAQRLGYGL
jgi:hypothetical protein